MLSMFRSRKYLHRILLYICLVMVLLVVVSSFTVYYNAEKTVVRMQADANQKVLGQMNFNMAYMNEMIKASASSLFFDNDMAAMLYGGEDEDHVNLARSILRMNSFVASTAFLESIVIYNGSRNKFFSTNSEIAEEQLYPKLQTLLDSAESLPKMKLIPMSMDGKRTDFFSFIIFESFGQYHRNDSALIYNVRAQWLFDNIALINNLELTDRGGIYVMTPEDRFLNPEAFLHFDEASIKAHLTDRFLTSNAEEGYFSAVLNGHKYLVTYQTAGINSWKIVTVQPYESLMSFVNKLRTVAVLSIAIFLLIAVLLALFISFRLYVPIGSLVRQVKGKPDADHLPTLPDTDELAYLSSAYERIFDQMKTVVQEKDAKKEIIRQFYMEQFLTSSEAMKPEEIEEAIRQYQLHIVPGVRYRICVLKIDRLKQAEATLGAFDRQALHFAVLNIAGEIIARSYVNQTFDARSDHFAVLISTEPGDADRKEDLAGHIREVQRKVAEYYHVSLSAAISEDIRDFNRISRHYRMTLHMMKYRIVFGGNSLITPDNIADNENNPETTFTPEAERLLVQALKSGNEKTMAEQLDRMIRQAAKLQYDHLIHAILRITVIIRQVNKEIDQVRINPTRMDLTGFPERVLELETLEEMAEMIRHTLEAFAHKRSEKDDEKLSVLVRTIKEIIDHHYSDLDLSLQKIASMVKLSSSYVGKIFNHAESMSVAEYINQVRLNRTLQLLEQKNYSVHEIMAKVGFSSDSNFYKLFKSRFGTTPKEYRVKSKLKEIDE